MRLPLFLSAGWTVAVIATSAAHAAVVQVGISDYTYTPETITVHPGDTIVWTNGDGVPHTATSIDGKSFDTGAINPGASDSVVVLLKPGEYPYRCAIHPEMRGVVDVK